MLHWKQHQRFEVDKVLITKCLNSILCTIFWFFWKIVEKKACLLTGKVKKLACFLACWHTKLKNWHAFGMLACKNKKLACFYNIATHDKWFSKLYLIIMIVTWMLLWISITNPYAIYISPAGECTAMLGQSKNCSPLQGMKASLKTINGWQTSA